MTDDQTLFYILFPHHVFILLLTSHLLETYLNSPWWYRLLGDRNVYPAESRAHPGAAHADPLLIGQNRKVSVKSAMWNVSNYFSGSRVFQKPTTTPVSLTIAFCLQVIHENHTITYEQPKAVYRCNVYYIWKLMQFYHLVDFCSTTTDNRECCTYYCVS
jgi:hypothetical protein